MCIRDRAVGIHLLNGLLILWLLVDLALATKRRQVAYEIGSILLYSALLAGPFFMWLAIGPGEARTPQEVLHFFLEYHVSGEFLSFPATWLERCVECYSGLRAWLFEMCIRDSLRPGQLCPILSVPARRVLRQHGWWTELFPDCQPTDTYLRSAQRTTRAIDQSNPGRSGSSLCLSTGRCV